MIPVRLRHFMAALALAACIAAGPALAEGPETVALTPQAVQGVIASYPAVKAAADSLEARYGHLGDGKDVTSALSALGAVSDAQGTLDAAVKPYGFTDYQTWIATVVSVATAYAFSRDGGQMDSQLSDALKQIQDNPDLPPEQKQMLIQQMQASMGAIQSIRPPQANIDAVTPYADQLQPIFDSH